MALVLGPCYAPLEVVLRRAFLSAKWYGGGLNGDKIESLVDIETEIFCHIPIYGTREKEIPQCLN